MSGTKTVSKKCVSCKNTSEHVVWKEPHGPQIGTIFSRTKMLGMKKYYLICPVCSTVERELTREQVDAMKNN